MHLFLDTANIGHIRHGVELGVISGVTTNPSLVSKEGKTDYQALVKEICSIVVPGPVSTEVLSQNAPGMIAEAREISKWADNIVVKIPASLGKHKSKLHFMFLSKPGFTRSSSRSYLHQSFCGQAG